MYLLLCFFFFFKQKTAYEMRISDWSSDVCSSDLPPRRNRRLIASRMQLLWHRRRTRSGTTKPNARWMRHRFLFFPRRLKRHPPEQRRKRRVASRASSDLRSRLKAREQWSSKHRYISTVKQSPEELAGENLAERTENAGR